jgi:hypothetical protein
MMFSVLLPSFVTFQAPIHDLIYTLAWASVSKNRVSRSPVSYQTSHKVSNCLTGEEWSQAVSRKGAKRLMNGMNNVGG